MLPSKDMYYIEFKKNGYEKKTFVLSSSVGGVWVILDVVCGLLPVVIDAATGSWYEFDTKYAGVYLEAENQIKTDSINSSITNLSTSSDRGLPSFFSIQLKSDKQDTILAGKVLLSYISAGWGQSLLTAKGIDGFSENLLGAYQKKSIHFSKGDVFYLKLKKDIIYKIEVVQEVLNTLSLEFTKV